jgi:hypothetical protein
MPTKYCETLNIKISHPEDPGLVCLKRAKRFNECAECLGIEGKPNSKVGNKVVVKQSAPKFKAYRSGIGIIALRGEPDPKRTPRFLSVVPHECPQCQSVEFGNIDQERFKQCSYCLMSKIPKGEKDERISEDR